MVTGEMGAPAGGNADGEQVAQMYTQHANGIRLGILLI